MAHTGRFTDLAVRSARGLYLDFLAPRWSKELLTHKGLRLSQPSSRCITTSKPVAQQQPRDDEGDTRASQKRPAPPLTSKQKAYLDSALRVNQAGELAATLIYAAQIPPLVRAHPGIRPLMEHMASQEAGHLRFFNDLLARRRIRPTAMTPIWHVAATTLGWATGVLGKEAGMACTEAVEIEIGEHYNDQVRELLAWQRERKDQGEELGEELETLLAEIRRIRDEELEHMDHAIEHDAKQAEAYPVLTSIIRGGCKGAIWLSQRV